MLRVRVQHRRHRVRRPNRKRRLLHHDLVAVRLLRDRPRRRLPVLQIRGITRPLAKGLRRRVHPHEDDVTRLDRLRDVRREEKILPAARLHHLIQPRLIDRQTVRVPRRNPLRVDVHHQHLPVRVHLGDHRHRRPANIPRPNARNVSVHTRPP